MSGGQNYLLITRNGHGQSEWYPIGCEGLYFHAMCKNRVGGTLSVVKVSTFNTTLNIYIYI